MLPAELRSLLNKQHYKLAGRHSAVKVCLWTKRSIQDVGFCYKQKFYGIECHRCLQMTPAVSWCTHRCIFCWRNTEYTLGQSLPEFDDPDYIIDESILQHQKLLSGLGGTEKTNMRKLEEAMNPRHAAISLSGEPTIYPRLDDLIGSFHRRGFTTYLVSNGTFPEKLESLANLPTQLYVSLDAPSREVYLKTDLPLIRDGWERINRTLELFPSLDTKKVVRLTLVRDLNATDVSGYAKLISKAQPDFVEVKSFMFVGSSRCRDLSLERMLKMDEIMEFSRKLAAELGYKVKDSKADSRVALISK
ncbi:MAG: 4-demethylwyosine synthase TYW1 [Candidatus Altiarchaeota archaeon]|nr:4-demethylwyosine synthase TYW1 [Candidatus Altiarchaeota archaeon]